MLSKNNSEIQHIVGEKIVENYSWFFSIKVVALTTILSKLAMNDKEVNTVTILHYV